MATTTQKISINNNIPKRHIRTIDFSFLDKRNYNALRKFLAKYEKVNPDYMRLVFSENYLILHCSKDDISFSVKLQTKYSWDETITVNSHHTKAKTVITLLKTIRHSKTSILECHIWLDNNSDLIKESGLTQQSLFLKTNNNEIEINQVLKVHYRFTDFIYLSDHFNVIDEYKDSLL